MAYHFGYAIGRGPDDVCGIGDQRRSDHIRKAGLDEMAHVSRRDENDPITHECIGDFPLGVCFELLQPKTQRLKKFLTGSELLILIIFEVCHTIEPRKLFDDATFFPFHH